MTPHNMTPHNMTPHNMTPHNMTPHCVTPVRMGFETATGSCLPVAARGPQPRQARLAASFHRPLIDPAQQDPRPSAVRPMRPSPRSS